MNWGGVYYYLFFKDMRNILFQFGGVFVAMLVFLDLIKEPIELRQQLLVEVVKEALEPQRNNL